MLLQKLGLTETTARQTLKGKKTCVVCIMSKDLQPYWVVENDCDAGMTLYNRDIVKYTD